MQQRYPTVQKRVILLSVMKEEGWMDGNVEKNASRALCRNLKHTPFTIKLIVSPLGYAVVWLTRGHL